MPSCFLNKAKPKDREVMTKFLLTGGTSESITTQESCSSKKARSTLIS